MIMIDDDNMVISYLFHFSLNSLLAMYSNKLWWLWSSWWWTQRTSKSDHLCAVSGTPASISPMPSPLTRYQKVIYLSRDSVSPQQVQFPPVPAWRIWRALYCLLVIILHIAVEVLLEDVEGSSSSLLVHRIIGLKCSKKILFFPLYCKIWFDAPWAEDYLNFICQSQYLKFGTPLPNSR